MNVYYLLAVDCIPYYVDVQYRCTLLTHLRMKSYITYMYTYSTYFFIPHSIFSHREEGKEKRKKKDIVNFAL